VALGGYFFTAALSALIGVTTTVWQVALLRIGAWVSRGLRVPAKTVIAWVLIPLETGEVRRHLRTFSTMTARLLALADWLESLQVTVVAMESTGIFWRPVFNLLEEGRTIILVNAQHMKAVPGRKTDIKDSEWIADLLRHGLLRASFLPPAPIREWRDLTRYRKTLIQERSQQINRLQKVLETANVKLAAVVSDVPGQSGRAMLEALVRGTTDAEVLADLALGRLRKKLPELREALEGRVQSHHRLLLKRILAHIHFLEETLEQLQAEIEERLAPLKEAKELLMSIPAHMKDHYRSARYHRLARRLGKNKAAMVLSPPPPHTAPTSGYAPPEVGSGWKAGRFSGRDFTLQSDGTLRCPANQEPGAHEQSREADGSLRVVYGASIHSCRSCSLREQCQWNGGATRKPRQVSVLLHSLASGSAPLLWCYSRRREHQRACMQLVRHQRIEVGLRLLPPCSLALHT